MITYLQVLDAVNTVNGHRKGLENGDTVKQLVKSLELYKDRGEFKGDIYSAYVCLELAGYELEETQFNTMPSILKGW